MSLSFARSCLCLSLKTVSIIIGLLGLVIGILKYVHFLQVTIRYAERTEAEKHHPGIMIIEIIEELIFMYSDSLTIIFSGFLIYGAVKNYPMKTCFIFAWIIYLFLAVFMNFLNVINFIVHQEYYFISEEVILTGIQSASIYFVYSYYHSLPKQSLTPS